MNKAEFLGADSARNYGVDLLRLVAMFFVTILHVLGQGGVLSASDFLSANYVLAWLMEIISFCAVVCFALISGYVGVNAKYKYANIGYLCLQVIFYSIIITILFWVIKPELVGVKQMLKAFCPLGHYWYFTSYFWMFFFIPLMNKIVCWFNVKHLKWCISIVIIVFWILPTSGYNALWLAMLYMIGGGIYRIQKEEHKIKYGNTVVWLIYVLLIIITLISKLITEVVVFKHTGAVSNSDFLIGLTSPTIVLSAIMLLLICSKIKLAGKVTKLITILAPLAFGIYLVHTHPLVWTYILKDRFSLYTTFLPIVFVLSVLGTALAIWVVCILIDAVRFSIFKGLKVNNICRFVEDKIRRAIKDLKKKRHKI